MSFGRLNSHAARFSASSRCTRICPPYQMNLGAPLKVVSLCDLLNVIRILGASKSASSEGREPFDLREIGGQS